MIKSMTGFGRVYQENEDFSIEIEIKTLNSKGLDLIVRLPHAFSDKEIEVRNLLSAKLERGKIVLGFNFILKGTQSEQVLVNRALLKAYFDEFSQVAEALEVEGGKLEAFKRAMQMPEVCQKADTEELTEKYWEQIQQVLQQAILECERFRLDEGKILEQTFREGIRHIRESLTKIEVLDNERIPRMRERLHKQLGEIAHSEHFDANRFEQELIYYIEKFDISEEKVRLAKHLDYFVATLSEAANGKKLGFISQEIGREINTIGSKANDAEIQRIVVGMKDELEKIKEQGMNVL